MYCFGHNEVEINNLPTLMFSTKLLAVDQQKQLI